MTFHAVSLLISGSASLLLGGAVFWWGREKSPNRNLALLSLAVAVWCLAQAFGEIVLTKAEVMLWTRINIGAAVFIPVFYLQFILSYLDRSRKALSLAWIVTITFIVMDFTPLMVADVVPRAGYRYWATFSIGYLLFAVFLGLVFFYGTYLLFKAYISSSGAKSNQMLYLILATIIGIGGGATNFFPIFGINFPALAQLSMPLYLLITVYAILKHKLVDIRLAVSRGLVYSALTAVFAGVYAFFLFAFKNYFETVAGMNSIVSALLVIVAVIFFLEPLRSRLQGIFDRLFFKQKYDYQRTVEELSRAATTTLDEQDLKQKVIEAIESKMLVSKAEIVMGEKNLGVHELVLPIRHHGRQIGFLNLGPKLSGDIFTPDDIALLTTLANQLAIALENSELYRQMLDNEKAAAMRTLAAGLAHEIKNPLASIKGLTQILPENLSDKEFMDKYQDIVPRQLDRINGIVETMLRIGKPAKYVKGEVDLARLIEDILRLVENQCMKKGIKLIKELRAIGKIEGDQEALTQAFMNLILNAIEAMPNGGQLIVEITPEVCVIISDTGHGIKLEDVRRIFDPFFTTKEAGSGLGLAVTERVIREHKGEIEVESVIGKGTRFKVWLSTRPKG